MTISKTVTGFFKAETVNNLSTNGGRAGYVPVIHAAKNNLFPRVTKAERTSGITRYRKEFWKNRAANNDAAYGVKVAIGKPSNAGDRMAISLGTQSDRQSDWVSNPPLFMGCGSLNTALAGGETKVALLMEANDCAVIPGGFFFIHNKVRLSQTVASDVANGDSVLYSGGTWIKTTATDDIAYPKGIYLGDDKVYTEETGAYTEEYLKTQTYLNEEVIGTGDGADTSPLLADLAEVVKDDVTMGVVGHPDYAPVVTATCGGVTRTITIDKDGNCSGYCTAGEIDLSDGTWITEITFTTAPDSGSDITITYYTKNYSYSGNVMQVHLEDSVSNAYLTTNTYGAGCIGDDDTEVVATYSDFAVTSSGGSFNNATYPIVMDNRGAVEETWTLTMTSPTTFTASGANEGSVGTGGFGAGYSDFSPVNSNTGHPYFTLPKAGASGSWLSGDKIVFKTHPAFMPIVWREIVPAGTAAESINMTIAEVVWE